MKKMNKVVATVLAGVMLCGFAVTVNAADSIMREPVHVHAFSVPRYTLYNSFSSGTHQYVSGYKVDPATGKTTPTYSSCTILVNQYAGTWTCGCGATNGIDYRTEMQHTRCGQ